MTHCSMAFAANRVRHHCGNPKGLRSRVLSNLLAQIPPRECEPLSEGLPCKDICSLEND